MTDSAVATVESKPTTKHEYETALLERVVVMGDLAKLTPEQRVIYYREVCQSLRLNPLTRPFDYLVLNGAMRLYANKTATDQLRSVHGIGIDAVEHAEVGDLYIATVHGHDRTGRKDTEVGAVNIANLKGDNRANAIMKAITKAKRRLTLSLAGLGWLDDSEVGTLPDAQAVDVDPETGVVQEPMPSLADAIAAKHEAITSGPATPEAGSVGGEDSAPPLADDPPHPAETGARASQDDSGTPMPVTTAGRRVRPSAAESNLAVPTTEGPDTPPLPEGGPGERCSGFNVDMGGRCEREPGHEGLHRSKSKESWAD